MKRSTPVLCLTLAVAALWALAVAGLDARAEPPKEERAREQLIDAARAQLESAERVCQMFHDRESGAPRGIAGAEANYLWSKRRMMAEIELISLDPEIGTEAAAIRRHLDWMKQWNKTVEESGAFSQYEIATTEYYIAEAEAMLAVAERP